MDLEISPGPFNYTYTDDFLDEEDRFQDSTDEENGVADLEGGEQSNRDYKLLAPKPSEMDLGFLEPIRDTPPETW